VSDQEIPPRSSPSLVLDFQPSVALTSTIVPLIGATTGLPQGAKMSVAG
jgi:hypothetical protein